MTFRTLTFALLIVTFGCTNNVTEEEISEPQYQEVVLESEGIAIRFPVEWTRDTSLEEGVILKFRDRRVNDNFMETSKLEIFDGEPRPLIEQEFSYKSVLKRNLLPSLLEVKKYTTAQGINTLRLVYRAADLDVVKTTIVHVFIHNKKEYHLIQIVETVKKEEYEPVFMDVVNSIRFYD